MASGSSSEKSSSEKSSKAYAASTFSTDTSYSSKPLISDKEGKKSPKGSRVQRVKKALSEVGTSPTAMADRKAIIYGEIQTDQQKAYGKMDFGYFSAGTSRFGPYGRP